MTVVKNTMIISFFAQIITLFLGVYPRPFLDLVSSTLNLLIESVVTIGGYAGNL